MDELNDDHTASHAEVVLPPDACRALSAAAEELASAKNIDEALRFFGNQIVNHCRRTGVDYQEVLRALREDIGLRLSGPVATVDAADHARN